jgi:DNA-binding NarL/FixJ family response regulator
VAILHLAALAWFAAVKGDDEYNAYATEVRAVAPAADDALAASIVEWGVALADLANGCADESATRLLDLPITRSGSSHPLVALLSAADLVQACVRSGRDEHAQAAHAALERFAQPGAPSWALALAARCRALLSQGAAAEREFAEALRMHARANRPFDAARTELLLGEHLRRTRRPADAREHLRAALEVFETMGAAPWADRARAELRAAGETTHKRDPDTLSQLTPQELQVAQFVSQGLSNKEVAAQLFLSPRTIEYHLRKVFMKLGISSRAELIRDAPEGQPLVATNDQSMVSSRP